MSLLEQDLWDKYEKQKDGSSKEDIIIKYMPLVKHIVKRICLSELSKEDTDDLISQGMIGLIDAVNKYDVSKGVKFETYASIRIKGEIIDYLRKKDWIPRSLKKRYKSIEKTIEQLEQEYKREPTIEEIMEATKLSKNDVLKTLSYMNAGYISSLDEVIENNLKITSITDNEVTNPENEVMMFDLKQNISKAIDTLQEKERLIISLYYYEDLNYKEISKIMGLTESRISQIHSKAIKKLKEKLSDLL
ncbi:MULTISPECIES: sigma-70 family RNA polymerase sigma factor [Thermoanaerobacterium]|uniref:RNA polymerase sigma factor n=1 Tax=Thermoanaerobacterium xylanolyticum (strain ATCC 49914 / DSM 7097 / LX-11) TaxID=858215 RepID=F6BFJ9_THEXL|nr:FliA/WhiG family RNA polymerase sigma factor [Thermoanaerobacterium xylanolyticum]AEF17338.1 RNA polymerase, sigma 28 subunit, FliA/WhiG [Thermoanaerobacterium xylanolyticum LX-11]